MDHDSVRKMLAWVAYARRPLLFGEINLILSLAARRPNLLLWASLRGRFASIVHLKFPKGYNPEEGSVDKFPKHIDLTKATSIHKKKRTPKPLIVLVMMTKMKKERERRTELTPKFSLRKLIVN
jgi:hypothetical protein